MAPEEDPLVDLEGTLEDYRKAKWAQLSDDGALGLRRERAELDRFLKGAKDIEWASDRLIAFREAKLEILDEILQDVQTQDADGA